MAGLIGAVSILPFLPAAGGVFLRWDDDVVVVANASHLGFRADQLRWMFATATAGHYQPLTWLSYAADKSVWGMNPVGFHITNLLLHGCAAALVFLLTLELLAAAWGPEGSQRSRTWAAAGAAMLFSVHPLRVESVAWITERRDVLSLALLLGSVILYVRFAARHGRSAQWPGLAVSLVLYVLSLLAKPWGMTLPLVLLILDAYPLRRWRQARASGGWSVARLLIEKLPYAAAAAGSAFLAFIAQRAAMFEPAAKHDLAARIAQSLYGLTFYVWKTLVPTGLGPIYELPPALNPWEARFLISAAAVAAISLGAWALRRRYPGLLAVWAVYVVVVSPVLGLAQVGPQLVADRYSYIACIPFAMLAGASLFAARVSRSRQAAVGVLVLLLAAMTWRQSGFWKEPTTLWTRCLELDPGSCVGNKNMGVILSDRGDTEAAAAHFRKALAVRPDDPLALSNLGAAEAKLGRTRQALECYRRAAKHLVPNRSLLLNTGEGLLNLRDPRTAYDVFSYLAQREPDEFLARLGQARAAEALGRTAEAVEHYEAAARQIETNMEPLAPLAAEREVLSGQRTTVLSRLVNLYRELGQPRKAAEVLRRL